MNPLAYLRAGLVAALVALVAFVGWRAKAVLDERNELRQVVATQAETIQLTNKVATVTSTVLSARVQSSASIKQKAKDVQVEIEKRLPAAGCILPPAWRLLHDSAATDTEVPDTTGGIDAEAVTAKEAASTVTQNYEIYHDTADRLVKLQQWIEGVSNGSR